MSPGISTTPRDPLEGKEDIDYGWIMENNAPVHTYLLCSISSTTTTSTNEPDMKNSHLSNIFLTM